MVIYKAVNYNDRRSFHRKSVWKTQACRSTVTQRLHRVKLWSPLDGMITTRLYVKVKMTTTIASNGISKRQIRSRLYLEQLGTA